MYQWQSTEWHVESDVLTEWADLHGESANTPLLHPDFLLSALQIFGRKTTRLASCRRNGQLVAVAAFEPVGFHRMRTFQPSQAPIGFWLQRPDIPTSRLVESLANDTAPWVGMLEITQQDPEMLRRPEQRQMVLTDYIDTARISVDGDWESYWKQRGSNLRHNIKRANAKLASAGKTTSLRTLRTEAEMDEAVRRYGEIESRSWKAAGGTAVRIDNEQGKFYLELLRRFARRGRARCYQLLIDGEVAASDLCVQGDEEIIILKTTFDDTYRDYSPAFLMREAAFRALFAEGWCKRIEFYGRVKDWHLRWTNEVRRMYHSTYFRYRLALPIRNAIKRLQMRLRPEDNGQAANAAS